MYHIKRPKFNIPIDLTLPLWHDLIPVIFEYLDVYDVRNIRLTCKLFNQFIKERRVLKKIRYYHTSQDSLTKLNLFHYSEISLLYWDQKCCDGLYKIIPRQKYLQKMSFMLRDKDIDKLIECLTFFKNKLKKLSFHRAGYNTEEKYTVSGTNLMKIILTQKQSLRSLMLGYELVDSENDFMNETSQHLDLDKLFICRYWCRALSEPDFSFLSYMKVKHIKTQCKTNQGFLEMMDNMLENPYISQLSVLRIEHPRGLEKIYKFVQRENCDKFVYTQEECSKMIGYFASDKWKYRNNFCLVLDRAEININDVLSLIELVKKKPIKIKLIHTTLCCMTDRHRTKYECYLKINSENIKVDWTTFCVIDHF